MSRFTITNLMSGETIPLVRDARHHHPEWVLDQLGVGNEHQVQGVLDHYRARDAVGKGPDTCGVTMYADEEESE